MDTTVRSDDSRATPGQVRSGDRFPTPVGSGQLSRVSGSLVTARVRGKPALPELRSRSPSGDKPNVVGRPHFAVAEARASGQAVAEGTPFTWLKLIESMGASRGAGTSERFVSRTHVDGPVPAESRSRPPRISVGVDPRDTSKPIASAADPVSGDEVALPAHVGRIGQHYLVKEPGRLGHRPGTGAFAGCSAAKAFPTA